MRCVKRTAQRFLAVFACTCLVLSMIPAFALAETAKSYASVVISSSTFPDSAFRTYVSNNCDADGDGTLSDSEIAAVTSISVASSGISDLTGVEYFTALEDLSCNNNALTKLDLSKNTELVEVNCTSNLLTTLDVSTCTKLDQLLCSYNYFEGLDVSKNTALTYLACADVEITELDVSSNTKLGTLTCSRNNLTQLDVSENTALVTLSCSNDSLTDLDLSQNIALETLSCSNNQLTELDLSHNKALTSLTCDSNYLKELDISVNEQLKDLSCSYNQLVMLTYPPSNTLTDSILRSVSCPGNSRTITLDKKGQFDLSSLSDSFDVSCARNWKGATVQDTTLTADYGAETVTYSYYAGYFQNEPDFCNFTLAISNPYYGDTDKSKSSSVHTQTIKVKPAKKTLRAKKLRAKAKKLTFKVTGAKGKLVAKASSKKAKKVLKVKVKGKKKVLVTVAKKAKKGTYKVKVYASKTATYRQSAAKTIQIQVK